MKKLLLFAVVLLFGIRSLAQISTPIPDTTKVEAWWPICGDLLDHSNHGFDLINLTTATFTTDRYGSGKSAIKFNGTSDGLVYSAPLYVTPTLDFSYSCWILPLTNQNSVILHNGNPILDGMGLIMSDGAGGPGNKVSISFGALGSFIPTAVSLGNWHHVAFTRNGNAYTLYVDGVNAGFTVLPAFTSPTNLFTVGYNNMDGSKTFNGKIDDIIYYRNKILNITDVHNMGSFNPKADTFTLGNDTALCDTTLLVMQDTVSVYPWLRRWSIGGSLVSMASSYMVNIPPFSLDTVHLVLEVSEVFGCSFSDTINVSHVRFKVNIGNDTAFCLRDTLQLRAQGGDTANYTWAKVMMGIGIDTLAKGLGIDTFRVYRTDTYLVIVDSNGCKARDTIKVYTAMIPKVHLGPDTSSCAGKPVTLRDTATYGSPYYFWSNGSSVDSAVIVTSGDVWLRVTDTGCAGYDTVNVFIAYDTFTLHTPNTAICLGGKVDAMVTGANGLSYQWTPTAGIPFPKDTSLTPSIKPDTSAWYVVTATVGSCHAKDSFFLDVQPNPLVYLGGNRHVCEKDSIRLTPVILPTWYTGYNYNWTPGTYLDFTNQRTVRFTAGDTTRLILTVTTSAGCSGSDSMDVFSHLANFVALDSAVSPCPGDTIIWGPRPNGNKYSEWPVSYAWYPAADFTKATDSIVTVHVNTSKTYIGVATSKWGCKDTMHVGVAVQPGATFFLEDSVVIMPGESYHISPQTNANTFHWSPGVGLSDTTISNPVATPPINTQYIVTAVTAQGCVITDSIKIRLDAGTLIAVPNAFSPNGYNSRLNVIKRGALALRFFRIYDKWGNMLFETKDIEAGWDGMYKGSPMPMGVYVYEVEAVNERGKILRQQGNVTLLK